LTVEPTPGVRGQFATVTVPTGATPGWAVTGPQLVCNSVPVPFNFSLQLLAEMCPGTNIVAGTRFGAPGGISVVTGLNDGAGWAGWTGVIDDLRINASQYDLEPARITITPTSPATLPSRDPQTVTFTLQASGWNTFFGLNTTPPVIDQPIVGGSDMQVGFRATGATTVTGSAGTVPVASQVSQLTSPPPPVTFTLDVTAALIGSGNSITVDWIVPPATGQLPTPGVALNAVTDPAATILQLPPPPTTTAATTTTSAPATTTTAGVTTTTAVTVGPTTSAPRRPYVPGPQTLPATGPRERSERLTGIALGAVAIGMALVLVARRRADHPH
jgi:hypothetical protein